MYLLLFMDQHIHVFVVIYGPTYTLYMYLLFTSNLYSTHVLTFRIVQVERNVDYTVR